MNADIRTVKERFWLGMAGLGFGSLILMGGLFLLGASPIWYWVGFAIWMGALWALSVIGQHSPWTSPMCFLIGFFAPAILLFLLLTVYLPGKVVKNRVSYDL